MNKHFLFSELKSTGTAYACWFFFGCHYAYLGKWGLQILYWITLGGLGFWALFDLFHIPSKVSSHNYIIAAQINDLEKQEKEESAQREARLLQALR